MTTRIDSQDPAVRALRAARAAEADQRGLELRQRVRQLQLETHERGAIIRFTKDFDNGDTEYNYVAIKCGIGKRAVWFVTGNGQAFTDQQLEELMVTGGGFRDYDLLDRGLAEGKDE